MTTEDDIDQVRARFEKLAWILDERTRRLFAAAEAAALGHGGVARVARATGISRRAIHAGIEELSALKEPLGNAPRRIRKEGGGRKPVSHDNAELIAALKGLVEPAAPADPESPLRWTCKSLRTLAIELTTAGHPVSYPTVGKLLCELGYNPQVKRKLSDNQDHPDRDAQFAYINRQATLRLMAGNPVIAVDTRKSELAGAFDSQGTHLEPAGTWVDAGQGGWSNVGRDHDTASFAVETIRRWWNTMGRQRYPAASELMITADGGGGGGRRVRLWKLELQRLADEIRLPIHISHVPAGTCKWNKIEHRLFAHVNLNWRDRPLIRHEVMVSLIAGTITGRGLKGRAAPDQALRGDEVESRHIHLVHGAFHGEWNYRIDPDPEPVRRVG